MSYQIDMFLFVGTGDLFQNALLEAITIFLLEWFF